MLVTCVQVMATCADYGIGEDEDVYIQVWAILSLTFILRFFRLLLPFLLPRTSSESSPPVSLMHHVPFEPFPNKHHCCCATLSLLLLHTLCLLFTFGAGVCVCVFQEVAELRLCCPLPPGWEEHTNRQGEREWR